MKEKEVKEKKDFKNLGRLMHATAYNRTAGNCLLYYFPPNWVQPTGRNEVSDLECSCECHSHLGLGPKSSVHQDPIGASWNTGYWAPGIVPGA